MVTHYTLSRLFATVFIQNKNFNYRKRSAYKLYAFMIYSSAKQQITDDESQVISGRVFQRLAASASLAAIEADVGEGALLPAL